MAFLEEYALKTFRKSPRFLCGLEETRRREWRTWRFLLAFAAAVLAPLSVESETSREFQIKAAFLFNFSQFTEWPPQAFPEKDSPLVIGVLSTPDPFGGFLEETVKNEAVLGRKLVVKHFTRVAEIETCHILYIGQSEAKRLDQIVETLKVKPVLTVSDIADCTLRGVMIGFVKERNKIRFRINASAARAANLNLSSKLLRAAEIVGPD
jgi:hypothetical protein